MSYRVDNTQRWIPAAEVRPGMVAVNPYGGKVLEIDTVDRNGGLITFGGVTVDEVTFAPQRFSGATWKADTVLWLIRTVTTVTDGPETMCNGGVK